MKQPWYITPKTHFKEKRAIIIGGGLAGTSAAYSLAMRGWEVELIERAGQLASEASGNPVGILTPLITHKNDPIGEFYLEGFEYSLKHLQKLAGQVKFNNSGVLELNTGKIDSDITNCLIPSSDITKLSPDDASRLCGVRLNNSAIYLEKGGYVNPADVCRANILAGGDNIKTIFSQAALSLEKQGDEWAAIDDLGNKIASAPVVIIGNAADAANFAQTSWVPLQKVRGQLTYLPAGGLNIKKIICYDGGYITPEINGFNYVGATYSRDNMSPEVSDLEHIENIRNLKAAINIADVDIKSLQGRVSFRAAVIDRRPVIGAVPDIAAFHSDYADLHHGRKYKEYPPGKYLEGLYVSTGYGSRGLTSCPVGGELLAAMINNEERPLEASIVDMLNPARFIIKKLKTHKG